MQLAYELIPIIKSVNISPYLKLITELVLVVFANNLIF
jgi:hypothetical protein